jgi:uncharacterized protein (DUF488 family)
LAKNRVFTIGYQSASQAEVIAALAAAGVSRVIDVRDLPLSRRAGFSKRQLEAGLTAAGIAYVHLRALGTPAEGREANRRRQWARFWPIVEAKLASPEAQFELQQAARLADAAPSCLLCYEADWRICHRRRIAELLAQWHGFEIGHLDATPQPAE